MLKSDTIIACGECGQLHRYQQIAPYRTANCTRCNGVLYRNRPHMLESTLALSVAGLILFIMANAFPLLSLKAQGIVQELTIWKASMVFWSQDYYVLAVLLLGNLIIFPVFELLTLFWVFLSIRLHRPNRLAIFLFRMLYKTKPWAMLEVFMLGTLVAMVKLGDLATMVIGPSFWAFAFLILSMAAATVVIDPFRVWAALDTSSSVVVDG